MNYPLISEYIEAVMSAEDNFNELSNLRPILDDDGQPVFSGGNFAVVFKMRDEQTGKLHAVKCFLKEQEGRAEAYGVIAEELEFVHSTCLTPSRYLEKELFVDTNNSDENEFPVLLMDWVEGVTLDKYIREHIDNQYVLAMLAYQFSRLAMWLMPQTFAHGDLKPDNILIKDDGTLVLVDYDGMYVPAMKGQKAREFGSPDFRHPSRTENDFNEHIDDFALATILLSLKTISLQPRLLQQYSDSDRLLLSEKDYRDIKQCSLLKEHFPSNDSELNILLSLFILALEKACLTDVSFRLFNLKRPQERGMAVEKVWTFQEFAKDYQFMVMGRDYCSFKGGVEPSCIFWKKDGIKTTVFNFENLNIYQINNEENYLTIELRKSGHFVLCHSAIRKQAVSPHPCIMKKEILIFFEGMENVTHCISKKGEAWISKTRTYKEERDKKGARKINTYESGNKHIFFLMDDNYTVLGKYYMAKELQGKTPKQIISDKLRLFFFESWNPTKREWVPCIGINN